MSCTVRIVFWSISVCWCRCSLKFYIMKSVSFQKTCQPSMTCIEGSFISSLSGYSWFKLLKSLVYSKYLLFNNFPINRNFFPVNLEFITAYVFQIFLKWHFVYKKCWPRSYWLSNGTLIFSIVLIVASFKPKALPTDEEPSPLIRLSRIFIFDSNEIVCLFRDCCLDIVIRALLKRNKIKLQFSKITI